MFRKYICDVTHYKSFGLVLTSVNEVENNIVFILDDIIFSCNDGYTMHCGPLISHVAAKCQSSQWQCFPPVVSTYCT